MYQICVSGAAKGQSVKLGSKVAFEVGAQLAKRGQVVLTGATTGLPYEAAKGAKQAGGQSVGLSPAASLDEHIKKYHLPTDAYDILIHTGLHYIGRDLLLVQSADAIISIGGRVGTWNEFTIAFETKKPIAVLEDSGGTSSEFKVLLKAAGTSARHIIYEKDPVKLVDRLIADLDRLHPKAWVLRYT